MAETDSTLTPEQRLLKLIENPQEAAGGKAKSDTPRQGRGEKAERVAAAQVNFSQLLSPSALRGRVAYVFDWIVAFAKGEQDAINIRLFNHVVKWAVAVFSIYLALAITFEIFMTFRNFKSELNVTPKEMAEIPEMEVRQIDPNLFQEIEKRNIFVPQEKRQAAIAAEATDSNSLQLVEITKDLKLTGISINEEDPSRTFCMVEDIKKNVTNFLKVGDTISGVKVDQINDDGIVLKHQKDSIELR